MEQDTPSSSPPLTDKALAEARRRGRKRDRDRKEADRDRWGSVPSRKTHIGKKVYSTATVAQNKTLQISKEDRIIDHDASLDSSESVARSLHTHDDSPTRPAPSSLVESSDIARGNASLEAPAARAVTVTSRDLASTELVTRAGGVAPLPRKSSSRSAIALVTLDDWSHSSRFPLGQSSSRPSYYQSQVLAPRLQHDAYLLALAKKTQREWGSGYEGSRGTQQDATDQPRRRVWLSPIPPTSEKSQPSQRKLAPFAVPVKSAQEPRASIVSVTTATDQTAHANRQIHPREDTSIVEKSTKKSTKKDESLEAVAGAQSDQYSGYNERLRAIRTIDHGALSDAQRKDIRSKWPNASEFIEMVEERSVARKRARFAYPRPSRPIAIDNIAFDYSKNEMVAAWQRYALEAGQVVVGPDGKLQNAPLPDHVGRIKALGPKASATSPVQEEQVVASEVSKKRKREEEPTQAEDDIFEKQSDSAPTHEVEVVHSVATAHPLFVKTSNATPTRKTAVAGYRPAHIHTTTTPQLFVPRPPRIPAPPPTSSAYSFSRRVVYVVSPVLRQLRQQQILRDGIFDVRAYIKAETDAELESQPNLRRGEVPAEDDSFTLTSVEEPAQKDTEEAKAPALTPAPNAQSVDTQGATTEAGEQNDTTNASQTDSTLNFEQFKARLVTGIFHDEELPFLHDAYLTGKVPFIEASNASVARATELLQNTAFQATYPGLYEAISAWRDSVVGTAGQQVRQPVGQPTSYPSQQSPDPDDTDMEDASYSKSGGGEDRSQGQRIHSHLGDGMEWHATGSALPVSGPVVVSGPLGSAQPLTPSLTTPGQREGSQQQTTQGQSNASASNVTSALYDELVTLEQQVLTADFGMSWESHFDIVKRVMLLLKNNQADAGVKRWLDSPDPLHNTANNRRLWWMTRVGLGKAGQIGETLVQDRDAYWAEQRIRRGGHSGQPTASGRSPARQASATQAKPPVPSRAPPSGTPVSRQRPAPSAVPHGDQKHGGRPAQGSSSSTSRPVGGHSAPPIARSTQAQPSSNTTQRPSAPQSTTADWNAISSLQQRLQSAHESGASWETIEAFTQSIVKRLKTIADTGYDGNHEVLQWMDRNSVFAFAQPRRGWFMTIFSRIKRGHSWEDNEIRDGMADIGVPYMYRRIAADEVLLKDAWSKGNWNTIESIMGAILDNLEGLSGVKYNKNAVARWLASPDPVCEYQATRGDYWQVLWNAQKTDQGPGAALRQAGEEYRAWWNGQMNRARGQQNNTFLAGGGS